ncbi:MAG: Crp/Fnr family transcriptional regulator [Actinomycetota bacterium]|nr:Crp/Fnr family transcriptional regulator [Actinomycetota bacterium]
MEEMISRLKVLGREVSCERGERLFLMGAPANAFFYLLEGEIGLYRSSQEAKEVLVAKVKGEGFIGEAAALARVAYPVSAQAALTSRLVRFEVERFLAEASKDPSYMELMMTIMAKKCLHLTQRIDTLGIKSPKERIAEYLIMTSGGRLAEPFELGTKKADLAKYFGIAPETLSRNLKQLQDEGLIEVMGRRIKLLDTKKLAVKAK